MKLATLRNGTRDGRLVVVRGDLKVCADAGACAPTLQAALDRWDEAEPSLRSLAVRLADAACPCEPFDPRCAAAPLPRAYEWLDGSAYLHHVKLARRARGAALPADLETEPMVYQGGSGVLLGANDDIPLADAQWGLDFESEVAVVLGDVRPGTKAADAESCVKLVLLANDVTLRNLLPAELARQFGFLQSKPATAFSPVACTPDELGRAWRDGRLHRRLCTWLNGRLVGDPDAGEMHFSFADLTAHVARTRALTAGTILGSGTVSNADRARGASCLAEVRAQELVERGVPATGYLAEGDSVAMEMFDDAGRSIFGRIEQRVVRA